MTTIETTNHPVLGTLMPDPIGVILGTNYLRFNARNGVHGLCKASHERLDILAICSLQEGRGHVREFIRQAKEYFPTIAVWQIFNREFEQALQRYGFTPDMDVTEQGEAVHGLRWDREVT